MTKSGLEEDIEKKDNDIKSIPYIVNFSDIQDFGLEGNKKVFEHFFEQIKKISKKGKQVHIVMNGDIYDGHLINERKKIASQKARNHIKTLDEALQKEVTPLIDEYEEKLDKLSMAFTQADRSASESEAKAKASEIVKKREEYKDIIEIYKNTCEIHAKEFYTDLNKQIEDLDENVKFVVTAGNNDTTDIYETLTSDKVTFLEKHGNKKDGYILELDGQYYAGTVNTYGSIIPEMVDSDKKVMDDQSDIAEKLQYIEEEMKEKGIKNLNLVLHGPVHESQYVKEFVEDNKESIESIYSAHVHDVEYYSKDNINYQRVGPGRLAVREKVFENGKIINVVHFYKVKDDFKDNYKAA
jgi:hypothetical protein